MEWDHAASPIGRRRLLKLSAGAGAAALLAACSRSGGSTPTGSQGAAKGGNPSLAVQHGKLQYAACLPLSGAFTIITDPWIMAIKYAADERNQAGGLKIGSKRVKVDVPVYDEGYAAAPALTSMRKFTSNGGHYAGGFVSEEAPVAVEGINDRAGLLLNIGVTGRPALQDDQLRFYEYELAQATGPMKAQFAYNELKLRRIATIELKNSWGRDYQESFAKEFVQLGGTIVKRDYMLVSDTDFTGILSSWKPLKPDGIYIIIGDGPGTTIAMQATELGFDTQPFLTEGAWDPNSYAEVGKNFIERCYYTAQYPYCHWSSEIQTLAERLYKDKKKYLTNWFWEGYDSTRMVFDAMELASSTDPRDVVGALPEAIGKGRDKWLVQAGGGIRTKTKGAFMKTPMYISKFNRADTDYLTGPPLTPVSNAKYQGFPGWLPESWEGYSQKYEDIKPLSQDEIDKLGK